MFVPNSNSILQAKIAPSDGYSDLTIYLRYSKPPTSSEYDWKTSLGNSGNSTAGPYWLFVSHDHMKGIGDYYIGVLPSTEDKKQSPQAVNYTFDVTCSACYFWNEHVSQWSSEGCVVMLIEYCAACSMAFFNDSFKCLNWVHFHTGPLVFQQCTIMYKTAFTIEVYKLVEIQCVEYAKCKQFCMSIIFIFS